MRCEICGRGPAPEHGGVTVHRQNAKGQIGIWRCTMCNEKPIDPETQELIDILDEWNDPDARPKS